MGMEFTLRRQEVIVPSPPSPPHVVTLTSIDQSMPPVYTRFLYFFPPPSAPSPSVFLTHSLAGALAAFPSVAGRLKPRSDGAGQMDLECHNQGAVFVEAHASTTLQHLLTTGNGDVRGGIYQPNPLWESLVPNPVDEEEPTDKPLLFTQLTRLGCGGVVVAVSLHHLVADGNAQAYFVASWAKLARGEPISAQPHLDRTCMQARSPPSPLFDHHEYIVHQTVPSTFNSSAADVPTTMFRNFEFLPEDIQMLKRRANAEAEGGIFTGFQALSAHIWKHVTKAKVVESSQQTKLMWTVDGRKRFNRPLPPNYFGNVTFFGCIEEKAGEVITQPMHCTAMRIQSAIQCITDAYLRSAMDLLAVQASRALINPVMPSYVDLLITSWVHFKAYDTDFGWGSPLFFAPFISIFFAGVVVLLPHAHSHGVNVLLDWFNHTWKLYSQTSISTRSDNFGKLVKLQNCQM